MISRKGILIACLVGVFVYAFIPRFLASKTGLPYHHFWDEPVIASGALIGMKTNTFIPYKGTEVQYGGGLRYLSMAVDYLYYGYLKLTDPDVHTMSDIKTYLEGTYKTTSHSGFYFWTRVAVSIVSSVGFVFAFLIGRIRGGYVYAFIAVLILAAMYPYFQNSYLANVDVPLSTMILGTMYFTLKFNITKNVRHLIFAFVFVGLAVSIKFTGALVMMIPFIAVLLSRKSFQWKSYKDVLKSLVTWGGISFLVYALLNPIIYTHPGRVFENIEWLGWVYRTGQGHFVKNPGFEHFWYQLVEMEKNLGVFLSILVVAGLIIGIIKLFIRKFWTDQSNSGFLIISVFPVFYVFYVTFIYAVAYHRNFYLMYPILAFWAAETCITVLNLFEKIIKTKNANNLAGALMVGLIFIISYPGYAYLMKLGINGYTKKDTRTKSILQINKMDQNNEKIFLGIDRDLLISPEDLKKLTCDYSYFDPIDIDEALQGFTHLLVPDYEFNKSIQNFDSLNNRIKTIVNTRKIDLIDGNQLQVFEQLSDLEWPVSNPKIYILQGSKYPPAKMKQFIRPIERREQLEVLDQFPVKFYSGVLKGGEYVLSFKSIGVSALDEYAKYDILVNNDTLGPYETSKLPQPESFRLVLEPGYNEIQFWMTNDYYDPDNGLDRNLYLQEVELKKKIQ